jgi:CRISPR-associated helicase Cas3/CRISPR-associated endonuclease Cas3-HD
MKNLLGKSDGTTLKDHSELVSKVAVMIYDITASNVDLKLRESIRVAALLHDIGKCTDFFQKKLKTSVPEPQIENNQPQKYPFRHNELGYAFLFNYLTLNNSTYNKKLILDAVYWHHGVTPDNFKKSTSAYKQPIEISKSDTDAMINFAIEVAGQSIINTNPNGILTAFNRPSYFDKVEDPHNDDTNQIKLFIRYCVISADRIVSSGACDGLSELEITEMIGTFNNKKSEVDVTTHVYSNTSRERFSDQLSIVRSIIDDNVNTHIIKAPAGFGKTMVSLLWALSRGKRLIVVCPRNDVAQSVYKGILDELSGFKNGTSVSVELYLTGDVVEKTHDNQHGFDSDIIVTNIDNFLNPSVDNRYSHRLFTIMESDVVFDEYHELVSDAALFALFINIMRLRSTMTNSSTLLLSATPSLIEKLWDTHDIKTRVLPNANEHYKPQHDKVYGLNVIDNIVIPSSDSSSVTILNSVSNAQRLKTSTNTPYLYHSNYTKLDRVRILSSIYSLYGKHTDRLIDKPNVIATHVLQASLDLSFNRLHESILSPEATLQRIGRCNRFGDYLIKSIITIFKNIPDLNNGENNIRAKLYTVNLTNMWFDYIVKYDGQELTLEQLYRIYNEYNRTNASAIYNHIVGKFIESSNRLAEIYPVKLFINGKSDVKTAGGNKLRNVNGDEIFVIARYYNDINRYSDPISVNTYNDFTRTFDEGDNQSRLIINQHKKLRDQNDPRFDFNGMIEADKRKALTLDHIRHHAKRENTPYIRFDKVYHPDYGFVSPDILK